MRVFFGALMRGWSLGVIKQYKIIILFFVLLFPMTTVSWFGWWGGNDIDLNDLEIKDMPQIIIPGDHGQQKGKVTFTRVGKELFQAFLEQKNHDMAIINQIIQKHEGSKYYHLYSAYSIGFDAWKNTRNLYERERIKRAVWNIAIEFANQQKPTFKQWFMQFGSHAVWAIVAMVAFLSGVYMQG